MRNHRQSVRSRRQNIVCTGIAHYRVCACCPDTVYGPPWGPSCPRCAWHVWIGQSKALHNAGDCPNWGGNYAKPAQPCVEYMQVPLTLPGL